MGRTIGVCAVADLVHLYPESWPPYSRAGCGVGTLPVSGGLLELGRITTTLDLEGRLLSIERTPTSADLARPATSEPDWTVLFTAAGLDITRFSRLSAEPRLEIADNRIAWTGPYFDANQTPVRIEASSFRGVVGSFAVVFPWRATSQVESSPNPPFYFVFMLGLSLLGLLHLMQGRGDTRSAWRFGLYAFSVITVVVLLVPVGGPALIIYGPVGAGAMAALMYLGDRAVDAPLVAARDDHLGTLAGRTLARSRGRS